jgi:hypothetical protein
MANLTAEKLVLMVMKAVKVAATLAVNAINNPGNRL